MSTCVVTPTRIEVLQRLSLRLANAYINALYTLNWPVSFLTYRRPSHYVSGSHLPQPCRSLGKKP